MLLTLAAGEAPPLPEDKLEELRSSLRALFERVEEIDCKNLVVFRSTK